MPNLQPSESDATRPATLLKSGFLLLWRDFPLAAGLAFAGTLLGAVLRDLTAAPPLHNYILALLLNGIFAALWLWRLSDRAQLAKGASAFSEKPSWGAFLGLATLLLLLPESLRLLATLGLAMSPPISFQDFLPELVFFLLYVAVSILAMAFVAPYLSGRLLDFEKDPTDTARLVSRHYKPLLLTFFLARLATLLFGFAFGAVARVLLQVLTPLTLEKQQAAFAFLNGMLGVLYLLFNLSLGFVCYSALKTKP